jgi:hypothetical protein
MAEIMVCTPKFLPRERWIDAANKAVEINPLNHAPIERLTLVMPGYKPQPEHLAVLVTKYWFAAKVSLTVGFLDNPPASLRKRILQHMNAWNKTANVTFVEAKTDPQVRISRGDGGYWSYLGTDILSVPTNEQTMNLQNFAMETPDSEFHRVVRHETGHTMGFLHEHMRQELVAKIDPEKAIKFFEETQGWNEQMVRQQVLTPIEESSTRGTAHADPNSIMCYQIPGAITRDGKPIIGGADIDSSDYQFAGKLYPRPGQKSSLGQPVKKHRAAA